MAQNSDCSDAVLSANIRSRLYELFGLIEKEFEALYIENLTLRSKIEELTDGGAIPAEKAAELLFTGNSNDLVVNKAFGAKKGSQMGQKIKTAFRVPQGKNLVSSFKAGVVGGDTGRIRFCRTFIGHRDGVWHVDVRKSMLCSASTDQTAKIWSIDTGLCICKYVGHSGSVNCCRFHPSLYNNTELLVVTASGDQSAHIWKTPSLQLSAPVQSQLLSPAPHHSSEDEVENSEKEENNDGELVFIHSIDIVENESSLTIKSPVLRLTGHTAPVVAVDWLATDNQIITASWDRTALIYDAERGEILNILTGHDQELNYCCAHASQKLVVTSSKDTTFRLWDFRECIHSVAVFQGHSNSVTSAIFSSGDKIISGSDDRTVKVWDFRNMRTALATIRTDSAVNRLSLSKTNSLIAIPTDNRQIKVCDLTGIRITRVPVSSRRGHRRMVCCAAWADETASCNLISCGFDRQVLGWTVTVNQYKEKD
ncbi:unnamed protein product [Soboliphyme baturini]|uniref:WD repeat-containing protein 37 n=1 Tax=Soboliphyme baturini TaxID=241478 RepID=A0A183IGH2_9BILA|nr:unnamed protein product [Soboliphyme baturini]